MASIKLIPEQIRQAWTESTAIRFPDGYRRAKNIVISGMGGSIYNYHVIESLYSDNLKVPLVKVNNYGVPSYVGPETLFVASSFSGTTEEVIHNLKTAREKGAMLTGVTEGGKVADLLTSYGAPFYRFDPVHNPSLQPRMGQGYMIFGALGILHALGYLDEAIDPSFLDGMADILAGLEREAAGFSKQLMGRSLVFVAADHLAGNAHILRNQTNETAKLYAGYNLVPELNHHLMEGLKNPSDKKLAFVFLDSDLYFPRNGQRMGLTQEVVAKNGLEVFSYKAEADTRLAQFVEILVWGGYLTYDLGKRYGEDPNKIPWVDYFKNKLGKKP